MKKIYLLLLLIGSIGFAQKVKIKSDVVSVDGVEFGKIADDDVSRGAFYFKSANPEQSLYFKWIHWGDSGYNEIYDAKNLDVILFETEAGIGFKKWIIQKLVTTGVITKDGINEAELMTFSKKMGKEFSRRRSGY